MDILLKVLDKIDYPHDEYQFDLWYYFNCSDKNYKNYFKPLDLPRSVFLDIVKCDGLFLAYGNENINNDREIVSYAVKESGLALNFASDELRNDLKFILECMKNSKNKFHIPNKFKKHRQLHLINKFEFYSNIEFLDFMYPNFKCKINNYEDIVSGF